MSGETLKKLRIFAASPSDVASERAKLETVVDSLKPMADYLGLTLEVVDWRAVVPDAGRPQQVIFDQLKPTSWDIFIGILWHRFGTPPGAKDKIGVDYLSGTEEEFKTAYELWKQHGKPRMILYRCTRALPFDVDPDQLKNVREFFKLIEDVKGDYPTLYQAFDTTESFEKLVLHNLQKLLIEYGEQSKTPITSEVVQVLAPKIPNNLPRRQAFFGRAKEMETVMRALSPDDRTWGVLVDGIGGIGKSAIALEAAYHGQEANLFDAFIFVTAKTNLLEPSGIKQLNPPAKTLDEFLNETARALGQSGIAKLTGEEKRRALIDVLRSRRTLLIYDNLETLSKEEQEGIADFLRELPQGCKAIITNRRRGGEGGIWLRVEKLDWDAALGIIKNQMSLDKGLANKLNHVGETRWQELFDETNGSPLALVHTLGLMRVRAALTFNGALEMLQGNRDEDLQKFIFQEARKELTENDKTALGALSYFVPSATFEAWMEVAALSRNALETTIDRLSALSLVDVLVSEERYSLHPLTRVYVRGELLADTNIARETGLLFVKYWQNYASNYGFTNYDAYNQLELEWPNINIALNILWEQVQIQSDSQIRAQLIDTLHMQTSLHLRRFLFLSSRSDDSIKLNFRAYQLSHEIKKWRDAGWHAHTVAWEYYELGQFENAETWIKKSREAFDHDATRRDLAVVMRLDGKLAMARHDYDLANQLFMQVLASAREDINDGSEDDVAIVLSDLGRLAIKRGDFNNAESYFREALEYAEVFGFEPTIASCLSNLGFLAANLEQTLDAIHWFEKALPVVRQAGGLLLNASVAQRLSILQQKEGRIDLALPLAKEALRIYEQLQHESVAEVQELVDELENRSE